MKLYIVIECPDDKAPAVIKAVAENAAVSIGGELKSAFYDCETGSSRVVRALGIRVHTRTEIYPRSDSMLPGVMRQHYQMPSLDETT